jgi:hypothetical protein
VPFYSFEGRADKAVSTVTNHCCNVEFDSGRFAILRARHSFKNYRYGNSHINKTGYKNVTKNGYSHIKAWKVKAHIAKKP